MTLVALSAPYGAAGSLIGPAVARQLGVPFVDRAIPMAAVEQPGFPSANGDEHRGWLERVLGGFVGAESSVTGPVATAASGSEEFRRASEEVLRAQAGSGRGVILGRAAVVVLRDDPRVLRVRLDGPPERRIDQAVALFDVDRDTAAEAVRRLDHAHDAYLREFYGEDIRDPALYHLMIDSTALAVDTCIELIVAAARDHTA